MTEADKDMVRELKKSVEWIETLIRDLETGRAKVVPSQLRGHVWEHLLAAVPAPSYLSSLGTEIPMETRTVHTDILKLWSFYVYIADCPKTGTRFVEG